MIIKTFRAETSSAALKRVRDEMGGDAIVLKTTQEVGALGRTIYEVTACLEHPTVAQTSKIFPDAQKEKATPIAQPASVQKTQTQSQPIVASTISEDVWQKRYEKLESKLNAFLAIKTIEEEDEIASNQFEFVSEQLREQDVCQSFISTIIAELEDSYDGISDITEFAQSKLTNKINSLISDEISFKEGDKVAFVGPAGSGKSSVMGKIATSLVMSEKKKVTLLTLDDVKMGAYDETAAYAEILGAGYADNRSAVESSHNTDTITLIDTVATPNIVENILPINEKLNAIGTTYRIAVFSAMMRTKDVVAMAEQISALQPTHLVITKTDLSGCVGTLVSAAHAFGLKLLYTSDSNGGIGVLHPIKAGDILNQLLPQEVASE